MLIQESYTPEEIEALRKDGNIVAEKPERIDLHYKHTIYGISLDERAIIDPNTGIVWAAHVHSPYIPPHLEDMLKFAEIEKKAREETEYVFYCIRKNPKSDGITVNILTQRGEPDEKAMGKALRCLGEVEKLILSD